MKGRTCASCKRRPASYYRRASGQPLCTPCLEEAVARAVKRSIRGLRAFKPGVRVGVYLGAIDPLSAAVLAYVTGLVERRYSASTIAFKPTYITLGSRSLNLLEEAGVEVVEAPTPKLEEVVWAPKLLRVERSAAALAALEWGANVALLPVTRTTLTAVGVEALMSSRFEYMIDVVEGSFEAADVIVAYGLRAIENEAVRALAVLRGLMDIHSTVTPSYLYKKVYLSVAYTGRPELEYSSLSAVSLIASTLKIRGRCRLCGGPIEEGGGCCRDCVGAWGSCDDRLRRTPRSPSRGGGAVSGAGDAEPRLGMDL